MKNKYIIFTLLLALMLPACRTKKGVTTTTKSKPSQEQVLLEQARTAAPQYNTLNASKVRISVTLSGKSYTVNGSLQIARDSLIILSVQPLLGIELYRAEIAPNTILVVDKMNRRYADINYTDLQTLTGLPIQFRDVQAIFTNQMFVVGADDTYFTTLIPDTEEDNTQLQLQFTEGKLLYNYRFSKPNLNLISTHVSLTTRTDNTNIQYLNHQLTQDQPIAETLQIAYNGGSTTATATITLLKYELNRPIDGRSISLTKYTQVDINDLLK